MKQNLFNKLWLRVGMIVAIMTTALSGTAWADEAVFDFTSMSAITAGQQSFTEGNITITCSQGAVALQNSTMQLRWYSGQTLTVSAASGYVVSAISITKGANDKGTISVTEGGGSFSENNWTGSAASVTLSSAGQSRVTNITVTYQSAGGTPTCATPTFSPAAGAVVSGTKVTITSADGATIYYTTNEQNPTTSSSVYLAPIEITAATTIKAIAVKDGYNNSEVATAAYTIKQAVSGYNIDFENDVDDYVDWEFENIGTSNTAISAHGGNKYGANINASGNAVTTASIKTKEAVALPGTITCYVSKTSSNTTTSTWKVQVSSDGSTWTEVSSQDATSMSKGSWVEFTANLSTYSNVYVRIYYSGSNAIRAIDDISITMRDPLVVAAPTISGTTPFLGSTEVTITAEEGATIYYTTDGSNPTTSSTQYNAPFTISATTTVKAIAVKDSKTSEVASKEFEKTTSYTIDELYALEDGTYYVQFENAKVTYVNGAYAYIEDANGALLYYKSGNGLTAGQVFNGYASVAWKVYSGQPEATSITGLEATTGEAPAPTTMTLAALVANLTSNMSKYVKLESVVAATTTDGFKLTQGESEIAFYGRNSAAVEDGKSYDIIGFLSKHNDVYQFMVQTPDHITELGVPEKSTTPTITVTGDETKTVTITAETGATIYYTTDGSDPTTESDVYTAELTFSEAGSYTIKAVALEDGKTLSLVATETFSISGPNYISLAAGDVVTTTTFPSFSGSGYKTLSDYMIVLSNGNSNPWSVTDGMKSGNDLQLKASSGRLVSPEIHTPYGYTVTVAYTSQTAMTVTSGEASATGMVVDEDLNASEVSLTVASSAASFTLATGSKYATIQSITIKAIEPYAPATITLNASGYATFASTSPVDLDETADCTAWAITAIEGTSITFTQVEGVVAAGTGLLLKGAAGATITPEYSTSAGSSVTDNLLEAIVTPTDIVADQYYGLSGKTFVKVNAGQVPAGKALLPASALTSGVKTFTFSFEDDATGISNVETFTEEGAIYNLAGQRLQKMQKGINIVNGKKILK